MKRVPVFLLLVLAAGCGSGWLPGDFEVPEGFETEEFVVRPIRIADAEMDYEAVMESIPIIHESLLNETGFCGKPELQRCPVEVVVEYFDSTARPVDRAISECNIELAGHRFFHLDRNVFLRRVVAR